MREMSHGLMGRVVSVVCAYALVTPVGLAQAAPQRLSDTPTQQFPSHTFFLNNKTPTLEVFGITVAKPERPVQLASRGEDITGLISCNDDQAVGQPTILNVSVRCSSFSILSTDAVKVEIPYDAEAIPDGVSEQEVQLYRIAGTGPMAPIESHIDTENKKTVATLSEQAGRYFNGVVKSGERPDKPPLALSGKTLEDLQEANPVAGLPIISKPQATPTGDLRLTYPLEFPGARQNLMPAAKIEYSAQSPSGNIANGWSLSVPTISVETRWGVPLFDEKYETETYLYNGEQLVPVAGPYLDAPEPARAEVATPVSGTTMFDRSDVGLQLVPLPHRTSSLRPRKKGNANFVLRRDEGLWRFIRHGDRPADYWWEAWQENPTADIAKVSYFGNAPGRIENDIEDASDFEKPDITETPGAAVKSTLTVGPVTKLDPSPIVRWGLARERDAFGNIVDYDWMETCVSGAGLKACSGSVTDLQDHDLYLKRIFYSAHHDFEELLLRCREQPDESRCLRKQGGYQVDFTWSSDAVLNANTDTAAPLPRRSDARSGGLLVPRRLLERIDVRFRRRETENGNPKPLHLAAWQCSTPFVSYSFERMADPLFQTNDKTDSFAPRWLKSIAKLTPSDAAPLGPVQVAAAEAAIFPEFVKGSDGCNQPGTIAKTNAATTRFAYHEPAKQDDGMVRPFETAATPVKSPINLPSAGGLLDQAGSLMQALHGAGSGNGPFRPSFLGSSVTEETGGGLYIGLSFGNPGKSPGGGFKTTYSSRQKHRELSLIQDVSGDGLNDLLISDNGSWQVFPGAVDSATGAFSFGGGLANRYPHGFRFQYEPDQSNRSAGLEGHVSQGAMGGFSSSSSSSRQTIYMADMDGDGRIDVLTPNGTFYNASGSAAFKQATGFQSASRYIGRSASFAPGPVLSTMVQPAPDPKTAGPARVPAPRYDTVRAWTAPYDGLLRVTGAARVAVPDESFHPTDQDPNARSVEHVDRDGVIVAIERSNVDGGVRSCDARALAADTLTGPQTPSPDLKGTWRLAGSTTVRERRPDGKGNVARYKVSLAGEFIPGVAGAKPDAVSVSIDLISGPAAVPNRFTEERDIADFTAAVEKAVAAWKLQNNPGLLDYKLGTLTYSAGVAAQGEEPAAPVSMVPLLIELSIADDTTAEDGETFQVVLGETSGGTDTVPSRVARDQGKVTTQIFDAAYSPSGFACLKRDSVATANEVNEASAIRARHFDTKIHQLPPGLFASVKAGDVLYFRANAIDNGNADIVDWSPEIQYLTAVDAGADGGEHFPLGGAGGASSAAKTIFSDQHPLAAKILGRTGTLCQEDEAALRLCDIYGRSILRYRPTSTFEAAAAGGGAQSGLVAGDTVDLATATGQFVAPYWGQLAIEGAIRKPTTQVEIALRLSRAKGGCASAAASAYLSFQELDDKGQPTGPVLARLPRADGRFAIVDNPVFVAAEESICLTLQYVQPADIDTETESFGFWPKDVARLTLDPARPITIRFNRVFEAQPGAQQSGGIDVAHSRCFGDGPDDIWLDIPFRCADISANPNRTAYLVTPRIDQVAQRTARLVTRRLNKMERPIASLDGRTVFIAPPPVTDAASGAVKACDRLATGDGVERRFTLPGRSDIIDDLGAPVLRAAIASIRYKVTQILPDGTRTDIAATPFIVKTGADLQPISLSHLLTDNPADGLIVRDTRAFTEPRLIVQDIRLVEKSVGTATSARFVVEGESDRDVIAAQVGYSVCAHPQATLEIEAAVDSQLEKRTEILDRLISTAIPEQARTCQQFSPDQIAKDAFTDGFPVAGAVPLLDRICPIAGVTAGYAAKDDVANRDWGIFPVEVPPVGENRNWNNIRVVAYRSLPLSFEAVPKPSVASERLVTQLESMSHRGAAGLSIKASGSPPPVELSANSRQLEPLPSFAELLTELTAVDGGFTDSSAFREALMPKQGPCSTEKPGNESPPVDQTAFQEKRDGCNDTATTAAEKFPGLKAPKAFPLVFAARFVEPVGPVGSTCRGLDQARGDKSEAESCLFGPDMDIWMRGPLASASRLGLNDAENQPQPDGAAFAALTSTTELPLVLPENPASLPSLAKSSDSDSVAMLATFGATVNWSSGRNKSPVDVADLNGDGYPEVIAGNRIVYSDPAGGLRCAGNGVWSKTARPFCKAGSLPELGRGEVRASNSKSNSLSVGYPMPSPTYSTTTTNSHGSFGPSTTGTIQAEGQDTTQPRFSPFGVSLDLGQNDGMRNTDILDFNGDGLPDLVKQNGGEFDIRLNLGYGFSDAQTWKIGELFKDIGTTSGSGINASYSTPDGAFGGGLDAGIGTSDQNQTIADINGDGLLDVIRMARPKFLDTSKDSKPIDVRLSTGSGLTDWKPMGTPPIKRIAALGRTETDRASKGGQFMIPIPIGVIIPIFLIINPNFYESASLTRQSLLFRDMDGDGLPDLVLGEGSREGTVVGNLGFSNTDASILTNGMRAHGLLTNVWLPTNPEATVEAPSAQLANYSFKYGRTPRSLRDPYNRWVFSELTVRDGVVEDDASEVAANQRRTCFTYDGGFHDRFERRFLGYSRVDTIEGCTATMRHVIENASAVSSLLPGVRRTERRYANGSLYENGLLLDERVFDLTQKPTTAGAAEPFALRWTRNQYILVDTARSTKHSFFCEQLRSADPNDPLLVKDQALLNLPIFAAFGAGDRQPLRCGLNLTAGRGSDDPSFYAESRRLTPTLLQTVLESKEQLSGEAAALVTAVQMRTDRFGRVEAACDLAEVTYGDNTPQTAGSVCSAIKYNERVRPDFAQGATGGGTPLIDQRNRVREITVREFRAAPLKATVSFDAAADEIGKTRLLRRRSAAYDIATGALIRLCEYADLFAADRCAEDDPSEVTFDQLLASAVAAVTLRTYAYDRFGNLVSFFGPVGSEKSFVAKRYRHDEYLNLIETSERTDYCRALRTGEEGVANCLDQASELGTLISSATSIDYRHAIATTTIDTNQNALHSALDPLGRPRTVLASWTDIGPACSDKADKAECLPQHETYKTTYFTAKPAHFHRLVDYEYSPVGVPSAVVERYTRPDIYRAVEAPKPGEDAIKLPSRIVADQLGQKLVTIARAEVCRDPTIDPAIANCQATNRFVISGLAFQDVLGRPQAQHYPRSADGSNILSVAALVRPDTAEPRSTIAYDGFDRPRVVDLPDGNAYDFQYQIAPTLNVAQPPVNGKVRLRHRTDMRNALCVPSAMERDVKGAIRTVIDSFETAKVEVGDKVSAVSAQLGSSASKFAKDRETILASGLVSNIVDFSEKDEGRITQQVQSCKIARGEVYNLASSTTVIRYQRDALGQLTAVDLPDTGGTKPIQDSILVAYDNLGRRTAIDDPDRGYEHTLYDPIGNAVCAQIGPRRRAVATSAPSSLWESIENGPCPVKAEAGIHRQTATAYLVSLPISVTPRLIAQPNLSSSDLNKEKLLAGRRKVTTVYGQVDPATIAANRAGRVERIDDASGSEARSYDALGRAIYTVKDFQKLSWKPVGQPEIDPANPDAPNQISGLQIKETYDVWGPLVSRQMRLALPAKNSSDPDRVVDEKVAYTYTVAGQIASVRRIDLNGAREFEIANGFNYDARGNSLGMAFGSGVETRNRIALTSNRLLHSIAIMGPATTTMPRLRFQDLTYSYDATGNVVTYDNQPKQEGSCVEPDKCTVEAPTASAYGFMMQSSKNAFAYDQQNRIRRTEKALVALGTPASPYFPDLDKEGNPQVYDATEAKKAKPIELAFNETFAFDPAHRMSAYGQTTNASLKGKSPISVNVTSTYDNYGQPRHAPAKVDRRKKAQPSAAGSGVAPTDKLVYDTYGRMTQRGTSLECIDRGFLTWNVDDTLRQQFIRIPNNRLSSGKRDNGCNPPYSLYFDIIRSEYDGSGRRVHKEVLEMERRVRRIEVNDKYEIVPYDQNEQFRSETLYADPQLTITRRAKGSPEAIVHYFAGEQRVASKWVGSEQLFTYHPHLLTRNVSDVVRANVGSSETARIHSQTEYAAFGDVLIERETLLSDTLADGTTSRDQIGLPQYRFNAKEQDETRFQDFGARFYDGRLALWLRPDPILVDYLDGRRSGGVYSASNLSSYLFSWGNPINSFDPEGTDRQQASQPQYVFDQFESVKEMTNDQIINDYNPTSTKSVDQTKFFNMNTETIFGDTDIDWALTLAAVHKKTFGIIPIETLYVAGKAVWAVGNTALKIESDKSRLDILKGHWNAFMAEEELNAISMAKELTKEKGMKFSDMLGGEIINNPAVLKQGEVRLKPLD